MNNTRGWAGPSAVRLGWARQARRLLARPVLVPRGWERRGKAGGASPGRVRSVAFGLGGSRSVMAGTARQGTTRLGLSCFGQACYGRAGTAGLGRVSAVRCGPAGWARRGFGRQGLSRPGSVWQARIGWAGFVESGRVGSHLGAAGAASHDRQVTVRSGSAGEEWHVEDGLGTAGGARLGPVDQGGVSHISARCGSAGTARLGRSRLDQSRCGPVRQAGQVPSRPGSFSHGQAGES